MVQYILGVNTEASFFHMSGQLFPIQVAVGTLLVFFCFFCLNFFCKDAVSVIPVCMILDFTAITYSVYVHACIKVK